jgi:hypothetical protein
MEFDGSGTFSATNGAGTDTPEHADVTLKWSTSYVGEVQSDGSITFLATGAAGSGEVTQTTAPPPGTFHFTSSGLDTADCAGLPLPQSPGAPTPVATDDGGTLTVQSITAVDQNDATGQISCRGTDPLGDAIDLSSDAANLAGTFAPYLPDVLSARISLPPGALKSGSFTHSVSSADAPQQLPSSCADQFGLPEGQCPMSLSWSGTIKITAPCGVVSFSEGDAPPVGAIINPGQTVSTGAKSRVEVTLVDGSIYRIGPSSKVQCNGQTTFTQDQPTVSDNFKLLLGRIWAATSSALGGDHQFQDTERAVAVGTRGSALTASVQPNGQVLYHVIEGTGFIKVVGKPEVDFPAGEGVLLDPDYGTYALTTAWPAADQALVPAAQMPPRLTGVRLTGAGKRTMLHFKLNENAAVTVQVQRGKRRVLRRKANAHRGAGSIKLGALPRGRYTLTLFATVHTRSAAAQTTFRVA